MYTGTLIRDLMAMVERAEQRVASGSSPTKWNCGGCSSCRVRGCRANRFSRERHKWQQHPGNAGLAGYEFRGRAWRNGGAARQFLTGTPEIYFAKAIDNSRLVKVEDPGRNREMKQFGTALAVLFLLVFTYAWQHFRAIEYGYQIESAKRELNNLTEMNRALRLEGCFVARSGAN